MAMLPLDKLIGLALLGFIPVLYKFSPVSKSTKLWTGFYLTTLAFYACLPVTFGEIVASVWHFIVTKPTAAGLIAVSVGVPLKYLQRKLRFARINAIKMKYGFTDESSSYENMTLEQAQEIETNMAETSTNPGVSRTISSSGHFINEDKKIEHQRMQATVHLMTGLAAYEVKSRNHSLVVARINEHHHRYGIKINSDDVLYLIIHFGLAPVPWINKFGYRKLEDFEVHAIWVLWRELACRMGVKYIPKTLEQAREWRRNFEKTFRWREDANEVMAMAMLNQVLYPIPGPFKNFVARVFVSIVEWDIVYYCQLEKLQPSQVIREVVHDIFRFCGFLIREFGLPRLSPYQRSPPEANKDGRMNFGHTPYDTMPWWQEATFWNLWGPRALIRRLRGLPMPSPEYESQGVFLEAMGAPHKHPATQSSIEKKVRENATVLENAPYGFRPAIGFQANRLMAPVDGPSYGSEMNAFPADTPTTPDNPTRFTRQYERRGGAFSTLGSIEKPEDVRKVDAKETTQATGTNPLKINGIPTALESLPMVSVTA